MFFVLVLRVSVDFTLKCGYARERKKRGKASKKEIQQAAAAAAAAAAQQNGMVGNTSLTDSISMLDGISRSSDLPPPPRPAVVRKASSSAASSRTSLGDLHDLSQHQIHHHHLPTQHHHHHHHLPAPDSPSMQLNHDGVSSNMPMHFDRMSPFQHQSPNGMGVAPQRMLPSPSTHNGMPQSGSTTTNGFGANEFVLSPQHTMSFPTSDASPLSGYLGGHSPEDGSPSWLSLQSPTPAFNSGVRYPVLLPLLPHVNAIITPMLACDLLDLYFTNPITAFYQPASPYVLTHIFRKQSVLHPTNPRPTSPALLCAMLWVSAQTCNVPFLSSPPAARGRVCQKLLEICISLLRPLVHVAFTPGQHAHVSNESPGDSEPGSVGIGFGGLGSGHAGSSGGREGVGAAGVLDDVLTYAHLGIVISASEFKSASLRWWHAAWTLARELKLNREVPDGGLVERLGDDNLGGHHSPSDTGPGGVHSHPAVSPGTAGGLELSEEEKEERRRTWWLLYIIDRHLALCYNRPLALLDVDCEGLYLPMDDVSWQNGDFFGAHEPHNLYAQHPVSPTSTGHSPQLHRQTGPLFEITGSGLFEFFLPLMTILGEIVDLHHARNRPKFATSRRTSSVGAGAFGEEYGGLVEQITQQLEMYARSLQEYEAANLRLDLKDGQGGDIKMTEAEIQTKIVVSYGTHVMHVLHILLSGKWDPINMLDNDDLWISSQSFINSTTHAVSAAEAISDILKYDPNLSFVPYFFGIYLLQGSFLLLLIADKLQGEASAAVVTACETIVRAHEVCVVTLNTEYQVQIPF